MTLFINVRQWAIGGPVGSEAYVMDEGGSRFSTSAFAEITRGRDLVVAVHGFNVSQVEGTQRVLDWIPGFSFDSNVLYIGVLWPGDCILPILVDYVYEGAEAIGSAKLVAPFLVAYAAQANSFTFVSHSLGARLVLETIRRMPVTTRIRLVVLMAGAIEDNCLTREYADVAKRVPETVVVASRRDEVLKFAYPPGNLLGEIVIHGHPYDRTALGLSGPALPLPANASVDAWQAPDDWDITHGCYMAEKGPVDYAPPFELPLSKPTDSTQSPGHSDVYDWKPAWAAALLSTAVKRDN